jgi:Flp pilus assembly protein TadB
MWLFREYSVKTKFYKWNRNNDKIMSGIKKMLNIKDIIIIIILIIVAAIIIKLFSSLIIILIIAIVGYFIYKWYMRNRLR